MRATAATSCSSWRVYIPASANLAIDAIGPDTSKAWRIREPRAVGSTS